MVCFQGEEFKLNQRGFTLVELLISIAMLAVIISIMIGALSMAYKTVEKGERKVDNLERRKIVFSLIESQIQSAFESYYDDQGEKKVRFSGEKDRMVFASNYSLWSGASGNSLVTYQIKTNDQGKSTLYAEERILGTDSGRETLLTKDYESITFDYFIKNSLEEGKWIDHWPEEEKNIPQKIRVNFTDGPNKKILTVNVFSKTGSSPPVLNQRPVATK